MMEKDKYFNFPIQLLQGFMVDDHKVLNNIIDYAIYVHASNLEFGSDTQRINDSANYYGITLGNAKNTAANGRELYDSIPEKPPMVGISKTMLFDFYKNDKTDFEKICLLGFLSIKSVIGKDGWYRLTNNYWYARMDGMAKGIKNEDKNFMELSSEIRTYANEYQWRKIKRELVENWGLIHYGRYTNGFYVSFKLELKALMIIAENARKTNKEKKRKLAEKLLLEEVLNELKARPK